MTIPAHSARLVAPSPLLVPALPLPWILAARPASLGLVATITVALASTLVLILPGAAEAGVANAIVAAVAGA